MIAGKSQKDIQSVGERVGEKGKIKNNNEMKKKRRVEKLTLNILKKGFSTKLKEWNLIWWFNGRFYDDFLVWLANSNFCWFFLIINFFLYLFTDGDSKKTKCTNWTAFAVPRDGTSTASGTGCGTSKTSDNART